MKFDASSTVAAVAPRSGHARHSPGLSRIIVSSYFGSVVEWFDFFIYAIGAATIFNVLFFTTYKGSIGTLLAMLTLATGYMARPIGGVVYGHFGDRIGRKKMLVSSILLMGSSTVMIGFLPTYAKVGIAAPVALVILRIFQGIAAAGEWGGAVLMTLEHANKERRGLSCSVVGLGISSGLLLATTVFGLLSLMPRAELLSWGWRIPFISAILLVGLALWLRLGIEESPVFAEHLKKEGIESPSLERLPTLAVLRKSWRSVIQAFFLLMGPFVVSAIISPFCLAYSIEAGFPRPTALLAAATASVGVGIGILISAWLSDTYGRRPVVMSGSLALMLGTVIMLVLVNLHSVHLLVVGFVVAGLSHGMTYGPMGAFISELFDSGHRFSGASIGYQLAGTVGGGFAPAVASALVLLAGGPPHLVYVGGFAVLACALTFLSAASAPETYRIEL